NVIPARAAGTRTVSRRESPMMTSTNFGSITSPRGLPEKERLLRKYGEGGKVGIVMHEFKHGKLRSGSKTGPKVTSRKQAIAIALSEKRRYGHAQGGRAGWWQQLQQEIADMAPQGGPLTG